MNKKNLYLVSILCVAAMLLSGCKTAQLKKQQEMQGMKSKIDTLESKVESMEARQLEAERILAERAMNEQAMMEEMKSKKAAASESYRARHGKSKERLKEIQRCLKNAGYYNGKIDGKIGKQSRAALKEFQKANNLVPDGVVGQRTWDALSKYAEGGAKSSEANIK